MQNAIDETEPPAAGSTECERKLVRDPAQQRLIRRKHSHQCGIARIDFCEQADLATSSDAVTGVAAPRNRQAKLCREGINYGSCRLLAIDVGSLAAPPRELT